MKFGALFFDFFGTLVDIFKVKAYFQNVREMAEILGVNPDKFNTQWVQAAMQREGDFSAVRDRIKDACKDLNANCSEENMKKAVEIRMNFFLTNTVPRPDAVPVLEWAKRAGYPLGLITNCTIELPRQARHPAEARCSSRRNSSGSPRPSSCFPRSSLHSNPCRRP